MSGTTKSRGRKSTSDKFYTKPAVALRCIEFVGIEGFDQIIEPSAGNGSFSKQIPICAAYDLYPEDPGVTRQDWFEYRQERDPSKRVLVIGNPPFGQQNTLAVRFINQAAQFADVIAFVLPISFKKYSVQNRLDRHLHRLGELVLPADSFTLDGADYNVPAVFQVWEWRKEERLAKLRRMTSPHFHFVRKDENPDCRVQRVGGNAGRPSQDLSKAAASNYFIKIDMDLSVEDFLAYVRTLVFPGRDFGVGPRTISKDEFIRVFEDHLPAEFSQETPSATR